MNLELPPTDVTEAVDAVTFLNELTGLSKSKLKDAMTKGAVWRESQGHSRRLRRGKTTLQPGDKVSLYYQSSILDSSPPAPTLVTDGGEYSVWIKPAGMMSGGSRFGDHCAINRIVEKELDRPTQLVHRLDRFVWGLMVLAHSKRVAAGLSRQFEDREVTKIYQAVVHGEFNTACTVNVPIDGREAVSHITPVQRLGDYSVVKVEIETGRKHQIRRHLAGIGHPVAGDRAYGSAYMGGIQLAAIELSFCPP